MSKHYIAHCDCGRIEISIEGSPKVHAVCHCSDCRELYDIPFYALTAWDETQVVVINGEGDLVEFDYPGKEMKRYFCSACGTTLFNTNVSGWRLVPQLLITDSNNGVLPRELRSDKHIFYESRVVNVEDSLPKYLRGPDGALYGE